MESDSRATAELDGGEGAGGAVRILQQLLHRDSDGNHSDRVWVRLVEDGSQALDGLGLSQRSVQGKDWLQIRGRRNRGFWVLLLGHCVNKLGFNLLFIVTITESGSVCYCLIQLIKNKPTFSKKDEKLIRLDQCTSST